MLERLVKPILDIYDEMEMLQEDGKGKDKALDALEKEYREKEARLEKEKDKIYDRVRELSKKQFDLRKKLGKAMLEAKCPMTTVEIDGKIYGICGSNGRVEIQIMTDTKEAEKLLAIKKMEKSK